MGRKRIEDLHPHYRTVRQCLQWGLKSNRISDKNHAMRDALHLLGFREEDISEIS